jgi:hypothetical protein
MRRQIVVTIDTGVYRRNEGESHKEFAARLDEALTRELNARQHHNAAWKDWDLLSVAPAGGAFPVGFYTSLWEFDDELGYDSTDEVEAIRKDGECRHCDGSGCVACSVAHQDTDEAQDGDTSPPVQFGEVIRVNGVRFRMVDFAQNGSGATVEFIDEREFNALQESFEESQRQIGLRPRIRMNVPDYIKYGR